MAKETKPDAQQPAPQAEKPHKDAFDSAQGEQFGGTFPHLKLEVGECSPRLRMVSTQEIQLQDDDTNEKKLVRTPVVENMDDPSEEKQRLSCPIGAIFRKNFSVAGIANGDEFYVKRFADILKKRGRGAGKTMMQDYQIKVVRRAPVKTA